MKFSFEASVPSLGPESHESAMDQAEEHANGLMLLSVDVGEWSPQLTDGYGRPLRWSTTVRVTTK